MLYDVTEHETDIFGLKYRPSILPKYDDAADQIVEFYQTIDSPCHFSLLNEEVLRDVINTVQPHLILEIGVHRPVNDDDMSSTKILTKEKPEGSVYIGIDIDPKSHIRSWGPEIYTIQGHSQYSKPVFDLMEHLGLVEIDLLFIDGNHSINTVMSDWKYTEKLSPYGAVVFHDTNVHPGPHTVFDAIDEALFEKEKFGTEDKDWGISVAWGF